MNEEPQISPVPLKEPEESDAAENTEEETGKEENVSKSGKVRTQRSMSESVEEPPPEATVKNEPQEGDKGTAKEEPPFDWFEPLEDDDDDANSWDYQHPSNQRDPEEESLLGETESVAGSDKASRRTHSVQAPRRKRTHPDEGWVDWPELGEGWKRKEVVRRSGSSIGQKDVYYMSPHGDRVRSRVELTSVLERVKDLSSFDYKTGKFLNGEAPPIRIRRKRKMKERDSSSESSWMDRGEGADTPDSYHRLTPSTSIKTAPFNQTSLPTLNARENPTPVSRYYSSDDKIRLPPPSSSRPIPLPSINGEIGTEDSTLVCARCGISFTGTWYDKQRKRPSCPTCWASKTREHPMIRFRKWIPCGQCVGCHNTVNCGQCANCKNGLQSPESRKRICRKRRCICPIRKGPGGFLAHRPHNELSEPLEERVNFQTDYSESKQTPSLKSSDIENFSASADLDDEDDFSTDDDDDWHKKRKRRSCGECKACLCRKDCGTCDFCIDKPKFGGSNKKRQKCRLRQCQRQAMMGQAEFATDPPMIPGRPRPHYTYSRKTNAKRMKGPHTSLDLSDDDDDSSYPAMNWCAEPAGDSGHSNEMNLKNHQSMQLNHSDFGQRNGLPDRVPHISNHSSSVDQSSRLEGDKSQTSRHAHKHTEDEDEELPMITQIFSLADNPTEGGAEIENQLMKLLKSLRSSVLPILWYAIMVEGPQLQLMQCSKESNMTDTMVLIDPGFCYQVTVQRQPLLPTHPLYDDHPAYLSSLTDVVNLLLDLDKYTVCQGLPPTDHIYSRDPVILERASTCEFLVKKNLNMCCNCKSLCG
ncbi:methyl-CpG-binding domain protein 1b isoform X2 [Sphaeramia orbicularis]|uniref:methyl-CpG-binding domain protein 1b isoform X2 n=1 Tax=Sphaeramia orbicularis TaxID=375764 RepID=UPI00117BFE8B|nr:uncharacterized protein LOC115419127 isoform X2 [Sphaeramia orbicularis]